MKTVKTVKFLTLAVLMGIAGQVTAAGTQTASTLVKPTTKLQQPATKLLGTEGTGGPTFNPQETGVSSTQQINAPGGPTFDPQTTTQQTTNVPGGPIITGRPEQLTTRSGRHGTGTRTNVVGGVKHGTGTRGTKTTK